ncbi:hypothetical protein HK102_005817 [Quaeritorhiza haematococci]|nr:hypothetical protein HK102_005817 [Quaeritorhiza haematococci]
MSVTETVVIPAGSPTIADLTGDIKQYTIKSPTGAVEARILSYGATLTHLLTKDKSGIVRDVVLGFDDPLKYIEIGKAQNPYFGCVVGRTCNRIAKGAFSLNGKKYKLPINNGPNSLHGGLKGFDKVNWTSSIVSQDPPTVQFSYTAQDGEEGYPGIVTTTVTYTLTDNGPKGGEIKIHYKADVPASEKLSTVVNLTNHSYFNLSGLTEEDVLEHVLQIPSQAGHLELTEHQVPTGKTITSDANAPMNFSMPDGKLIGADISEVQQFRGYDHFFVLEPPTPESDAADETNTEVDPLLKRIAARVACTSTGLLLEMRTTCPGFQLYTGNWLDENVKDCKVSTQPEGVSYGRHSAFCLEASHPPDAINHDAWRNGVVVKPGQSWEETTVYSLSVDQDGGCNLL